MTYLYLQSLHDYSTVRLTLWVDNQCGTCGHNRNSLHSAYLKKKKKKKKNPIQTMQRDGLLHIYVTLKLSPKEYTYKDGNKVDWNLKFVRAWTLF